MRACRLRAWLRRACCLALVADVNDHQVHTINTRSMPKSAFQHTLNMAGTDGRHGLLVGQAACHRRSSTGGPSTRNASPIVPLTTQLPPLQFYLSPLHVRTDVRTLHLHEHLQQCACLIASSPLSGPTKQLVGRLSDNEADANCVCAYCA